MTISAFEWEKESVYVYVASVWSIIAFSFSWPGLPLVAEKLHLQLAFLPRRICRGVRPLFLLERKKFGIHSTREWGWARVYTVNEAELAFTLRKRKLQVCGRGSTGDNLWIGIGELCQHFSLHVLCYAGIAGGTSLLCSQLCSATWPLHMRIMFHKVHGAESWRNSHSAVRVC